MFTLIWRFDIRDEQDILQTELISSFNGRYYFNIEFCTNANSFTLTIDSITVSRFLTICFLSIRGAFVIDGRIMICFEVS